jgi:hypothetical protein
MSDRLRRLMRARQNAMLEAAQARRPIDLEHLRDQVGEQLERDYFLDQLSPIPLGADRLQDMYAPMFEKSMARQILEQYLSGRARTMQQEMAQSGGSSLMSPMISSVVQLDR